MIVKIENEARDYAWGSTHLLADYLGFEPTGDPMAEVWFGTHPGSPTRVETGGTLAELRGKPLGFLLKFLAAALPLSIQVHPSKEQAEVGFAAEEANGVSLSHSGRNYKDANSKSESLVAITEFQVLAGLRDASEVALAVKAIEPLVHENRDSWNSLAAVPTDQLFGAILNGGDEFDSLVQEIQSNLTQPTGSDQELLKLLFDNFGPDRGVLLALFMRHLVLEPGQALVVPAGTPHSYLAGLGLEIQDNSDNVLRAGLTEKHVDVTEFLNVFDAEVARKCEVVEPRELAVGLKAYPAISPDYALNRIEVSGANMLIDIPLPGDSVIACVAGELAVSNSLGERVVLGRGEAAYATADAQFYSFTGSGTGYIGSELS